MYYIEIAVYNLNIIDRLTCNFKQFDIHTYSTLKWFLLQKYLLVQSKASAINKKKNKSINKNY